MLVGLPPSGKISAGAHVYNIIFFCCSEPPDPSIRALRDDQAVTQVIHGEALDVECTVERVYPVDSLTFQLMSGDTAVSSRQSGDIYGTNSDGTLRVTKVFGVVFARSYSTTEDGLTCKVYHSTGDYQSHRLQVIVSCE